MVGRQEGMARLVREFVDVLGPIVQGGVLVETEHPQLEDGRDLLLTYRKAKKFLAICELTRRDEKRKVYPDQNIDTRG